jgi:hypothetical protein
MFIKSEFKKHDYFKVGEGLALLAAAQLLVASAESGAVNNGTGVCGPLLLQQPANTHLPSCAPHCRMLT